MFDMLITEDAKLASRSLAACTKPFLKMRWSSVSLLQWPDQLFGLIALQKLDISGNALTELPVALSTLTNLQHLDVSNNCLKILPFWLGQMPKLRVLLAANNPLTGLQRRALDGEGGWFSLLGYGAGALLQYLRQCHKEVPLRRVQLVVLGHYEVGKTTILNSLRNLSSPLKDDRTLHVTLSEWPDTDGKITYSLRELPGQAQFYSTNRRFLTSSSSVVLVVFKLPALSVSGDCSDPDWNAKVEEIRSWLSLIDATLRAFVDRAPVRTLIIGTHMDECKVSREQVQKWAVSVIRQLCADYDRANIDPNVVLINAQQSRDELRPLLRKTAEVVLENQMVPEFFEEMHARWWSFHRLHQRKWLTIGEAQQVLISDGLVKDAKAARFALHVLLLMGDVLRIHLGAIVTDPEWLSLVLAAVVTPPGKHFQGIPEEAAPDWVHRRFVMCNGVVSADTLIQKLKHTRQLQTFESAAPQLSTSTAPALITTESDGRFVLQMLQSLDVIVRLSDQPELVDVATEQLTALFLVPARLLTCCCMFPCGTPQCSGRPQEVSKLQYPCLIGRRLYLSRKVDRIPPGFISDLVGQRNCYH